MIVSYWLFPKGDHCRKTAWTNDLSFKVQVKQITLITLQSDTTSFSLNRSKRKQNPRLHYNRSTIIASTRQKIGPITTHGDNNKIIRHSAHSLSSRLLFNSHCSVLTLRWFHRTLTLGRPLRESDASITSSWIRLQQWVISIIIATCRCFSSSSL